MNTFNDIIKCNWAWLYQNTEGYWTQFECLVCMILESKYEIWKKDRNVQISIKMGTVDFGNMTVQKTLKTGFRTIAI